MEPIRMKPSQSCHFVKYVAAELFCVVSIDEPDHEQTFWGDNLERLQQIKKAVDPKNVFTVWHGIGWEGSQATDFKCYDKYTWTTVFCICYPTEVGFLPQ